MRKEGHPIHDSNIPATRKIRRACNKELYRTMKRLKIWVPAAQLEQAEHYYLEKVLSHIQYIMDNGSNRKLLSDWWEEHVCPEIAKLWNVDAASLARAFREQFGG